MYIYIYVDIHIFMCICMYIYIYICIYGVRQRAHVAAPGPRLPQTPGLRAEAEAAERADLYLSLSLSLYIYIYTVCMCIYIYVYICICVHIDIYVYSLTHSRLLSRRSRVSDGSMMHRLNGVLYHKGEINSARERINAKALLVYLAARSD